MNIKILMTLVLIIFVGCNQQTKLEVPYSKKADVSLVSSEQLCIAYSYHDNRSSEIRQELINRKIFNDLEWQQINNGHILQGMTKYAASAAFGAPYKKSGDDKNIRETWTYSCDDNANLPYCPRTQITFQNEKIIAIVRKDDN